MSFDRMIRLHVLGAGGAVPTATHGPAAYWLEIDGHGLLLDPGPGALVRLVRQRGAPDSVDAIPAVLLSHLHLDHTADLTALLFALHSVVARAADPLVIAGPPGTAAYLDRLRDLYGHWVEPRQRELRVRELAPRGALDLPGGGRVEAFGVAHAEDRFGAGCLGYVFLDAAGRRLVYSGDTGPSPDLTAAARACDLLLVECTTPDDLAVDGHLSPARVADLARNTRPGRVVLTHQFPLVVALDPARTVAARSGVPCAAARDGDVFVIDGETEMRS
ncbi:MAG TPA: ribonuclease Z [Candidatus Krumholzibacteria bacterium]|nr:ribonuclease Z [Candidatus Krumholzibacteria bacterium]HPD72348.1 ribonuclease Z [Candidatus Krumholzibacteria bacterium]HRY40720.1 ribonuclease Z [Candidatus Krumholzibacteria bacterium]